MEDLLIALGEKLDALSEWIYSIASGLSYGDIEAPREMQEE